jgi:hypothetical protein
LLIRLFQETPSCSIGRVPRPPFPKTLREFQAKFATEEACQEYLAACRWPDGFVCRDVGRGEAMNWRNSDVGSAPIAGIKFR